MPEYFYLLITAHL